MKVCFWGTYRRDYSRNVIIRKGLMANGVEVAECHEPFLEDTKDRNETIFKAANIANGLFDLTVKYIRLIRKFLRHRGTDFIFVGYIGHHDMFIAKILSKIMKKKLIFDAFVSVYDSIVEDRALIKKDGVLARILRQLDKTACRLADTVLCDTMEHRKYFEEELKILSPSFHVLYLGADDSIYFPREIGRSNGLFRVLFYGYFVPLQGVEYIIGAAEILQENADIMFKIIGRGQDMPRIKKLIEQKRLKNIEFVGSIIPQEDLAKEIALSDACLGVFGNSGKTGRIIPNKVFQCLATRKPVITGDTPAVRELFCDGEDLILCKTADAQAIADSILELRDNEGLRNKIAEGGYEKVRSNYIPEIIGKELRSILEKV